MANSVYCDLGLNWIVSLLLEWSLDFLSSYNSVVTSGCNHQAVSFCILASLRWIYLQVGKRVFHGEETKVALDVGLCNLRTMFCMSVKTSHQINSPFMQGCLKTIRTNEVIWSSDSMQVIKRSISATGGKGWPIVLFQISFGRMKTTHDGGNYIVLFPLLVITLIPPKIPLKNTPYLYTLCPPRVIHKINHRCYIILNSGQFVSNQDELVTFLLLW